MVVGLTPFGAAEKAGVQVGDVIVSMNGRVPRDVIEYSLLADSTLIDLHVSRASMDLELRVEKEDGEPLGIEVSSAVFDRVMTCDNHCEFCFIYQLPKGMRRSLYLKDDDYRLSFLYGNFTTLTRFTEMDLERVVDERLSPLYVSIHAVDPKLRARMLRNPRGATSLRWLRALLDNGIEVHGQVVVCPGVNDGGYLDDTLAGVLDEYPDLASVAVVPLGVSRYSRESAMREHTMGEIHGVLDIVDRYQELFLSTIHRRMVFASDEYYVMAGRDLPTAEAYEGFPQHENGIGIARAFRDAFLGDSHEEWGTTSGFFSWVDGAPAAGYRAIRSPGGPAPAQRNPYSVDRVVPASDPAGVPERAAHEAGVERVEMLNQPVGLAAGQGPRGRKGPVVVLTGAYGARLLRPLLIAGGFERARVVVVENEFFGGNTRVAGLMVASDVARALQDVSAQDRVLLPDVCLSGGHFLDGVAVTDLPRAVEVVKTDGHALRRALLGESDYQSSSSASAQFNLVRSSG
ncbi:MAG: DUF512 domain-containing protein [Acidimicrobiales bacterium]